MFINRVILQIYGVTAKHRNDSLICFLILWLSVELVWQTLDLIQGAEP